MKIADWGVLIYSSGSRDIEANCRAALEEVAAAPLPEDVVVGAQLGTADEVVRFSLPAGTREHLPAQDMASTATLKDFLRWGMERFPAKRYAVVLGGHSAGFAGALTDGERRKMLRLPELAEALGELKPDVLVFNSCLMAQAEVAAEMAPVAGYLVASQTEEKGLGMPLGQWLQSLDGEPAAVARSLAQVCATSGERAPRVASIDLRAPWLPQLDSLARAIEEHPEDRAELRAHIEQEPTLWPRGDRPLADHKDLHGLLARWESDPGLAPELREKSRQLRAAAPAGLGIYAPSSAGIPLAEQLYAPLRLAQATRWDEALKA